MTPCGTCMVDSTLTTDQGAFSVPVANRLWRLPLPARWITLETWAGNPAYRALNGGFGNCNTEFGDRESVFIICGLGGIGCNVNHAAIKRAGEQA